MDNASESLWVRKNPLTDTESCLQCDYNIPTPEMRTPYCPWCGRKMINWEEEPSDLVIPKILNEEAIRELEDDSTE